MSVRIQGLTLHAYVRWLAAAAWILIIAGGLVTSTGSGLSVPDWPLSYGRFFPPMIGGIRFEHTHRVIAGLVGVLTLGMTVLFLRSEQRVWVKQLAFLALLMVVAQALLGALTVVWLLPTAVSVLHACLAQTFFCVLAALATVTSREWMLAPSQPVLFRKADSTKRLFAAAFFFLFMQLVTGAVVRHTAVRTGLGFHIVGAGLATLHVILVLARIARSTELQGRWMTQGWAMGLLLVLQIFFGLGAWSSRPHLEGEILSSREILFTTAHQASGALLLALMAILLLRALRTLRTAS